MGALWLAGWLIRLHFMAGGHEGIAKGVAVHPVPSSSPPALCDAHLSPGLCAVTRPPITAVPRLSSTSARPTYGHTLRWRPIRLLPPSGQPTHLPACPPYTRANRHIAIKSPDDPPRASVPLTEPSCMACQLWPTYWLSFHHP